MLVHEFVAKYGTQTTFYFMMEDGSSSTDAYVGTDITASDSFVYKDGGAVAATTNAVGTTRSPMFSITLTASELSATDVLVRITDASAAVFKDVLLRIKTKLALGQLDIDATQIGSNTNALLLTGVGTGVGLYVSGASAAYYTNLFSQLEGSEPSGMIADNATVLAILQFMKRRFGNKRTQTSTTFTQFKDDSSTSCWTATVGDDGTTQTVGKGA